MSIEKFQAQVALLRSWGFTVNEQPNCWGRSNGLGDYDGGQRKGQVNHHFVCPLAPPADPQAMVDMLVNGYDETPGPVVPWCIDAAGVIYLISTGPANHAGRGNSSVLARIEAGQAPLGPAAKVAPGNDFNGNGSYDGVELLHPGDLTTPYPDPMIAATVALNASRCIVEGQSANTSIMHYEHTDRKDDMSWRGGVDGDGGPELRKRVAALIASGGTPTPTPTEDDMFSDADRAALASLQADVTKIKAGLSDSQTVGKAVWGYPLPNTVNDAGPKSGAGRILANLGIARGPLGVAVNAIKSALGKKA